MKDTAEPSAALEADSTPLVALNNLQSNYSTEIWDLSSCPFMIPPPLVLQHICNRCLGPMIHADATQWLSRNHDYNEP